MRIADHIFKYMIEKDIRCLMWGDGELVNAAGPHVTVYNQHPLNVMTAALNAMERAPDLFLKQRIRGHDSRVRQRTVRGFRIHPHLLETTEQGEG